MCLKHTVDHHLYMAIDRWVKRRHPNKNRHWQQLRYFCQVGGDRWRFFAPIRHHGKPARVLLLKASSVKIQRHIKIRAMATPFDPSYREYFATRLSKPPRRAFSAVCMPGLSRTFKRLEPCEGKLSRTVLRGAGPSNWVGLPVGQGY